MNGRQGRGWAYACAQLGGAVSIAANYAHSYVPPTPKQGEPPIDPEKWSPEVGAVAFSVFWPVALFFAIEAFARVPWLAGRRWVALRFMGLLPVALVAAVVSYVHLSDLLAHYGAGGFESTIGPLAVDGLMIIGTGALIATSQARATVAAPVVEPAVDELPPDPWAYSTPLPVDEPSASESTPEPPTPAIPRRPARRKAKRQTAADRVVKAATRTPSATPAELAARLKISERTVQRHLRGRADDTVTTPQQPPQQVNGATVAALVNTD